MAWIDTHPGDDWDDELTSLVGAPGSNDIDAIMEVHGLNLRGLVAHHALYASAMSGTGSLRKVDRELVALVVSQINGCDY